VFIVGTQYSQSGISYGRLSSLLSSLTRPKVARPFFARSFSLSRSIAFVAVVFPGFSCCTALGVFQRQNSWLFFLAAAEKPRHNWQGSAAFSLSWQKELF